MPAGEGKDEARFAAAVETGGAGLPLDAALSRDLDVVAMVRSAGPALSPTAAESARMKERLFAAITAESIAAEPVELDTVGVDLVPAQPSRVVKHGSAVGPVDTADAVEREEDPKPQVAEPARAPVGRRARRKRRLASVVPIGNGRHRVPDAAPSGSLARRFVFVSSAAAALIVALSSTGVVLSADALPGDALYAMKRSAESATLNLTFGTAEKALKHLEFGSVRLDEVQRMVTGAGPRGADPVLVSETLSDFNSQARTGSRLLLAMAGQGDAAQLGTLKSWADTQAARLTAIMPALPAAAQPDGTESMTLLNRMQGRTDALHARVACREMASSVVDDLGPLPAAGRCLPAASDPTKARTRTPGGTPSSTPNVGSDPSHQSTPSTSNVPPLLPEVPGADPNVTLPTSPPAPSTGRAPEISLPPLIPGLPPIRLG